MANDRQKRLNRQVRKWVKVGKKAGTPRPGYGVRTNVGDIAGK
jgi:hypothetical protein